MAETRPDGRFVHDTIGRVNVGCEFHIVHPGYQDEIIPVRTLCPKAEDACVPPPIDVSLKRR